MGHYLTVGTGSTVSLDSLGFFRSSVSTAAPDFMYTPGPLDVGDGGLRR